MNKINLIQFSSVTQSCPTLCSSLDCSTPGLPVHHHSQSLFTLRSIESVMPSNHLILCRSFLLPPYLPASGSFPMSQFFPSGGQVLEFQLQHQSFQWIFRTDYVGREDLFCTVLCILAISSSASVRSIPFLSFIMPIFAWNVPLVFLIFLRRSLVLPILLFSSVSLHWLLRKAFLSLLAILRNSAFKWVYLLMLHVLIIQSFYCWAIKEYAKYSVVWMYKLFIIHQLKDNWVISCLGAIMIKLL